MHARIGSSQQASIDVDPSRSCLPLVRVPPRPNLRGTRVSASSPTTRRSSATNISPRAVGSPANSGIASTARRSSGIPPACKNQPRRSRSTRIVIQPRSAASSRAGVTSSAGRSPPRRIAARHCASARSALGPASHPRADPLPRTLTASPKAMRSDTRQASSSPLSLEPTPFGLRAPASLAISGVEMRRSGAPAVFSTRSRIAAISRCHCIGVSISSSWAHPSVRNDTTGCRMSQ